MRKFRFVISINDNDVGEGIIEIENSIIEEGLSQEFKDSFYTFKSPERVAAHIAWALVVRGYSPSQIEGWNMTNEQVKIVKYPTGYDDFEVTAEEIKVK